MPLIEYGPYKEFPQVAGVFLGGCVERGDGSSFRRVAHAHTEGTHKGFICVRSPKRLWHMDGEPKPSLTMVHELAHIVSGAGHTDPFRKAYKELSMKFWGFEIPDSWDRALVKKLRGVKLAVLPLLLALSFNLMLHMSTLKVVML